MGTDPSVKVSASDRPGKRRGERKRIISISVMVTFVLGIVFAGVFNVALDWTNQEEFCLFCHEMKDNVYREYQTTIHYTNRTGVRAVCADCHVPREFVPKLIRKVKAAKEVWHKILGTIDTPEKFAEYRPVIAQNEWKRMKDNNSQECRNCHDPKFFDFSQQGYRSVNQHQVGLLAKGQACIDCHKGVAHRLPRLDQGVNLADPTGISLEIFRPPVPAKETPLTGETTTESAK